MDPHAVIKNLHVLPTDGLKQRAMYRLISSHQDKGTLSENEIGALYAQMDAENRQRVDRFRDRSRWFSRLSLGVRDSLTSRIDKASTLEETGANLKQTNFVSQRSTDK